MSELSRDGLKVERMVEMKVETMVYLLESKLVLVSDVDSEE